MATVYKIHPAIGVGRVGNHDSALVRPFLRARGMSPAVDARLPSDATPALERIDPEDWADDGALRQVACDGAAPPAQSHDGSIDHAMFLPLLKAAGPVPCGPDSRR